MKALQAAKTTSPLVLQCQEASNDFSTGHDVGLYWFPGHAGLRGNRRQARKEWFCSAVCWTGAFLGVSRQNIRRKIKRWMGKQHVAFWRGPCSTQRQARELISGPNLATGTQLLSVNSTQCRVVIGLFTGQNTLRRHTHTHIYIYICLLKGFIYIYICNGAKQ